MKKTDFIKRFEEVLNNELDKVKIKKPSEMNASAILQTASYATEKSEDEIKSILLDTVKRKNADYSQGDDAFENFYLCQEVGVSVEQGMLVRICDKISRLRNLTSTGKKPEVVGESVADTMFDLINYMVILYIYKEN